MRVNIYIRKEDEEVWAEIEDKPKFIHNALNTRVITIGKMEDARSDFKPIKTPTKFAPHNVVTNTATGGKFLACKHGYDPKMCRFAKNGKPCK